MPDAIRGGLIVNEIHAQPVAGGGAGFDTDGNGTVAAIDEYIEFLNTSGSAIDLSGLQLWDAGTGNWFTFPPGSVLAAGGYAIVVTGVQTGGSLPPVGPGSLAFNAGRSTAVLNNPGDVIFVQDPATNSYIAAGYGTVPLFDPTNPATWPPAPFSTAGLAGFPAGATQIGAGEHFGAIVPGDSIQRQPDGGSSFANNLGETPGGQNICFAAGTRIALAGGGSVAVERLRPGDRVCRAGGGAATVRWVGLRRLSRAELAADPRLWPVEIAPGALGPGMPARVLRLSPQHRVQVQGRIAERLGGAAQVLVAALHLVGLAGVSRPAPVGTLSYVHFLCDAHEVVLAEGAPCETLLMGPMARAALPPAALDEIDRLFPGLVAQPAHPVLSGRMARALVARHRRHGRPLQASPSSPI